MTQNNLNVDVSFQASVSVIILTLNEEANIENCLKNIYKWSDDVHVVDSYSTDNTAKIAAIYTQNVHTVDVAHWADIRNWAMLILPLKYDWVIFLDADERLTDDLKKEIVETLKTSPKENGFYIKRRFVFMGRWLKHGGLYVKVLRLFRHEFAKYIPEGDVEYAVVEGKVGSLKNDMIHNDRKNLSAWIEKHNKISDRAAKQYLTKPSPVLKNVHEGSEIEGGNRTWIKYVVWDRIPLLLRPGITFFYQYVLKLGFLDGSEGLTYHLLQAYWYRLLIFAKVRELQKTQPIPI